MAQQKIFGYANRIGVKQGEEITFHVNSDGATSAEARLVRLIHGDAHEAGPGYKEEEVASPINGVWQVKKQYTQRGSFLEVADPTGKLSVDGPLTMFCYIWPTLPRNGMRQSIMGRWDTLNKTGYGIGINPEGRDGSI